MRVAISILITAVLTSSGDVGIQDDWSGGPGQIEPVTDWGDTFLTSTLVDWIGLPGSITLDFVAESY
jgi:hypothetical protein